MSRKRIIVMGFTGACPIAGVIWQHIHYIVGLARLGHEVFYIEDSARYPYNPATYDISEDYSYAVETLSRLANEFGFDGRWAYCARYLPEQPVVGLSKSRMRELYREADAILNLCGSQEFNEDILRNDRILYVESDPGVEQINIDQGVNNTGDYLARHHSLFTFGEDIPTTRFPVPLHGYVWHATRQPVVTDLWRSEALPSNAAVLTTVANWSTAGKKDIVWRGEAYLWSKSLEFLKFVEAPRRSGETFELAAEIPDDGTRQTFIVNGWRLILPHDLSLDHHLYRHYIQDSKGEFTAAKDQYVRLNTAWFSDRSACYLAAGRPVITQETGFSRHYAGRGLFSFASIEEVIEAVRAINLDYREHSKGAMELAREYFEAEKVLRKLLDDAGI